MAGDKGDTLRDILAGFSAMQANLGLLPAQSGSMPMGVAPYSPPPPPPMPHPSEFAMQISQQQQMMMQHTMQMAQTTRFQPPPSAPPGGGGGFTWGSSYAQMGAGQMNPMVANALGGGAGVGMPNPIYATAPQYGGYRPQGPAGGMMSPMAMRPPAIFNPFAAQLPAPHFMTPAMQSYQIMQAHQATSAGLVGGLMEGGLGLGGSMLGGAFGSAFGPLGSMAGSWLGGKVGGGVSAATIGPAFDDVRRGRQVQNMTAPWMVGGPNLNPFTGQGMNREAATDTARQLRTMVRDHEFQRTGFNTQDVMKITQLASDQGLMQTAQNPDDIARKVKDISKSIKALIQITGDPDVRNAIAHLGQMRQLGFEGTSGQMGAVANRAAFARMAGVSQGAAHEMFGMPGAMMAQNMGLAGATGYTAGVSGGGLANVAVSGGAFSDLQLARAGGKQGLGQMNAMAALGAINQDVFMGAALKTGPGGQIDVDPEAYRRATRMSVGQASAEAADRLSRLNSTQLMSWQRMQGELKDKLAQTMSPIQMQMNSIRQAQSLMKSVPGMDLGGALQQMTGGNAEAARALELEWTSSGFYGGMQQQLQVQRREAGDRARALREQHRTPGLLTNMGRGVRGALGAASDAFVNPAAALMERGARIDEDIAASARGERVDRFGEADLIRGRGDQRLALQAMRGDFTTRLAAGGTDPLSESGGSRWLNRFGTAFGQGTLSDANRAARMANVAEGGWFGLHTNLGDSRAGMNRLQSFQAAATGIGQSQGMDINRAVSTMMKLQGQGTSVLKDRKGKFDARAVVAGAARRLASDPRLAKSDWGGAKEAGAVGIEVFDDSILAELKAAGVDPQVAQQMLEASRNEWVSMVARESYMSGNQKVSEVLDKNLDVATGMGAMKGRGQRDAMVREVDDELKKLGLEKGTFSSKSFDETKRLIKETDPKMLALAAAKQTMSTGNETERGVAQKVMDSIRSSFGNDAAGERAYQEMNVRATALQGGLSKDVGDNIKRLMVRGGETGFTQAREQVGRGLAAQGASTALKKLQEMTGRSDLENMGLEGAAMNLTADEVSTVKGKDAALGRAIEGFRSGKGSREGLYEAALGSGASGTAELRGGERGGTAGIDQQISDLADLKDTFAKVSPSLDNVNDALKANTETTEALRLWLVANPHGSR